MSDSKEVPGQCTAERILEAYEAALQLEEGADTATYGGETFESLDDLIERIQEEPLSVLVNYGWAAPGQVPDDGPEEYEILLSTGGPAVRIWGKLGNYCEPVSATLEGQDWGNPWRSVCVSPQQRIAIRWYAALFYFGG